jgi:hypothetical protein
VANTIFLFISKIGEKIPKNKKSLVVCEAKRNPFKFRLRVTQVSDDIILMASNL